MQAKKKALTLENLADSIKESSYAVRGSIAKKAQKINELLK